MDQPIAGLIELMWSQDTAPVLKPMISDREYLIDQHLLVCLRSEEENEVIGIQRLVKSKSNSFKKLAIVNCIKSFVHILWFALYRTIKFQLFLKL